MSSRSRRLPRVPPPSRAFKLNRAADVVAAAAEGESVSALLRDRLRRPPPGWRKQDAAEVVELVHGWFRWRGGFEGEPTATAIATAARLQEKFAADPAAADRAELTKRALPAWAAPYFSAEDVRALQYPSPLWLRARPGTGPTVAGALPGASRPLAWTPDALCYDGDVDLFHHPLYTSGALEIQDLSSQWVAHLANAQPGETWWDVCAGEGGKTMGLADAMDNKGVIRATERYAWRIERLKRRAARLGRFNIRPEAWNGEIAAPPFKTWCDGVLLDAPCSGLGTWRRDPAARWSTDPGVVTRLAPLQATLLDRAASRVRAGGRLLYAVCTLTPEETTEQMEAFARRHPDFSPAPLHLPPLADGASTVAIRPSDFGSNGMFVAAWRKG